MNWSLGTTTFKMIRKVYTINTDNKLALAVCHYNCYACTRHYFGITVLPRRALCIHVVTTETCWGKVWVTRFKWLFGFAIRHFFGSYQSHLKKRVKANNGIPRDK